MGTKLKIFVEVEEYEKGEIAISSMDNPDTVEWLNNEMKHCPDDERKRFVSIKSILERMRSARVSKGHKDCYWKIEQELEKALNSRANPVNEVKKSG